MRSLLGAAISCFLLVPGAALAGGDFRGSSGAGLGARHSHSSLRAGSGSRMHRPRAGSGSRMHRPRAGSGSQMQRLRAFGAARQLEGEIRLRAATRDADRRWVERDLGRRGSRRDLRRYLRRAEAEERLGDLAIRSRLEAGLWRGAGDLPWLQRDAAIEGVLERGALLQRQYRREELRERGREIERKIESRIPRTTLGVEDSNAFAP